MNFAFLLVVLLVVAMVDAYEVTSLTPDNYDTLTEGKTLFVRFYVPSCPHSKKMAADWERLAQEWDNHFFVLVAEIDCWDDESRPLCDANHIRGFPTIKYGDPHHLHMYEGPRDFTDLHRFAELNLKPLCSPMNLDLCDEETRAKIEDLLKLSMRELDAKVEAEEANLHRAEEDFNNAVKQLQDEYHRIADIKDDRMEAVKKEGLTLMKAVRAHRKKMKKSSGESISMTS